jgi:VanZ family protein
MNLFELLKPSSKIWGWLSLAYMMAIFAVSSLPGKELPDLAGRDHYAHFVEFAVLGVFLSIWGANRLRERFSLWMVLLAVMLFVSFYGATDEIHQYFVPGRYCDLWDWVADTLGGVVSVCLILPVLWRRSE